MKSKWLSSPSHYQPSSFRGASRYGITKGVALHNDPDRQHMPYMRTNATIYHVCKSNIVVEGSLEVKLPTIWTDEKAEVGRVREETRREEKRRERKGREEKRKSQKKENAGARKGRKVAKHCVFQ